MQQSGESLTYILHAPPRLVIGTARAAIRDASGDSDDSGDSGDSDGTIK